MQEVTGRSLLKLLLAPKFRPKNGTELSYSRGDRKPEIQPEFSPATCAPGFVTLCGPLGHVCHAEAECLESAEPYVSTVGYRNFIVDQYDEIDDREGRAALQQRRLA